MVDDRAGQRVFVGISLAEQFGADTVVVAFTEFGEFAFVVGLDELDEGVHRGGAGGEVFEGAAGEFAVGFDDGVPDLASGVEVAVIDLPVENQAAADAGAGEDAEQAGDAFFCCTGKSADAIFAPGPDVDVVVDGDGDFEFLFEQLAEFDVVPSEVDRFHDDALRHINDTGRTDAEALAVRWFEVGRLADFGHDFNDAINYRIGAELGFGLGAVAFDDFAIGRDDADLNVGAAEVNADPVIAFSHGNIKT